MATSLENVGNEFEIANHEITAIAEKMKVWCIWSQLWPILYYFGYEIQNSVAMATSLVNFRKVSEIGDLYATSGCKNIEYAVHTTGIMTNFFNYDQFYIINQNLVAMATSLEHLSKIF